MRIFNLATTYLCLFIFQAINQSVFSNPSDFNLRTDIATLSIDSKNKLKIELEKQHDFYIEEGISDLWKVSIQEKSTGKKYDLQQCKDYKIVEENGRIHIVYDGIDLSNKRIPLMAEFTISVKDDAFCFSGSIGITSNEWTITELKYPIITGIQFKKGEASIYWPNGLGQYFDNPDKFGERDLPYPSGSATMPYFSINSEGSDLYIGSHDVLQGTKVFNLKYDKEAKKFSAQICARVYDTSYSVPDIMVKPYSGEWYKAAKFYRSWYDQHFKIGNPPEWAKNNSGWLLAILKQQNMEVMWPYKDLDKLCDIAERFNLGTIGLFGWGYGGHDHLYPFYTPDNTMGGRQELEKAIARAHKRGIRIIIYANGKIMDTSTDFYKYYGFETMLRQEDLKPQIQYYVKQDDSTPVIFAQACTGSDVWRRTMYDLSLQAVSLGADGILYDQLGIMGAGLCFSKDHDHKPGATDPKYRVQMVNEAREKAREINPEFIVMTEAANDFVSKSIDYTHGCGAAYAPSQDGFPELFRYTFPEIIATQRNGNPMITRTDANYAAVYGLRHEVETRYPGDVKYLNEGSFTPEDYANVVKPPKFSKMNSVPAAEAEKYVNELIAFENEHSDFFRRGKFIDEEGITVQGNDIVAKGFLNGDKIGVIVWNQHLTEKRDFMVTIQGYKPVKSFDLERKNIQSLSSLSPNSICLIVFEKV